MVVLWPNGSSAIYPEDAGVSVTAEFGPYNPFGTGFREHHGIDLVGFTIIKAGADGYVSFAGYNGSAGNEVRCKLDNGDVTRDLHNSLLLVKTGQRIGQGQNLAIMGSTGQSTGRHNHHETRPGGGVAINPREYYLARNKPTNVQEDEMTVAILLNNTHFFTVGEEFISHNGNRAQADITRQVNSAQDELHKLNTAQMMDYLDGMGIPRNVLDINGAVLNPQTGKMESNGVWSRRREAVALAQKNAQAISALSEQIMKISPAK